MLMWVVIAMLVAMNACLWYAAIVNSRQAVKWKGKFHCAIHQVEQAAVSVAKAQRLIDGCQHPHQPTASEQWPEFLREE